VAAAAFCLTPWGSPALALALGMVLAIVLGAPLKGLGRLTKTLLQTCVVLLGFGMDLRVVLRAGASGAAFAAVSIAGTLLLGYAVGRWLRINARTSALTSSGSAICGGSAIAAVGSVIGAAEGEIAVAMGTVFILNAAALYLFPPLGHLLHLSPEQFGLWAGVAIHDISSVVGASSQYGLDALQTATAVKLSRALWIVPVALGMGLAFAGRRSRAAGTEGSHPDTPLVPARKRLHLPWFIGLFLLASVLRSYVRGVADISMGLSRVATTGLTLTLFLVGAGLSRQTLAAVGWRALAQGVLLWAFIGGGSLLVILWWG
jgi:uncharacterized integral membrane protein (TIGR00698 family)